MRSPGSISVARGNVLPQAVRVEARVSVRLFERAAPACYTNEEDDMRRDSIRIAGALDTSSLKRSPPVFLLRRAPLGSHPVQIAASSAALVYDEVDARRRQGREMHKRHRRAIASTIRNP